MLKPAGLRPGEALSAAHLRLRRAGRRRRRPTSGTAATTLFHRALADAGYVVVSMDNRGTPAPKGAPWRKVVYGAVGDLSSKEQAAAVRALLARHPYLDGARVGVWGWSGGGSNTLNAMFRFPDVYKVGVSVAPVPDQALYDTIYQERYMGLPERQRRRLQAGLADPLRRGPEGRPAHHPRLGRRQRALPGHREARQPPDRARQAVRPDDLPEPHALDLRGRRAPRCTSTARSPATSSITCRRGPGR